MTLTFENQFGEERKIAEVTNRNEAIQEINKFLAAHNYTSYYTRSWDDTPNHTIFDVGSHTEFFHLRG